MKKSCKSSKKQIENIRVKNLDIQYDVEHRHVKYPRLEFKSDNKLLIILPPDTKDEQDLLDKKEEWIVKKAKEIKLHMDQAEQYHKMMGDKNIIFGNLYKIRYITGNYDVIMSGEKLEIHSPNKKNNKSYLKNWLKKELRRKLISYLENYRKKLDVNYNRIFIKSQKTKWASCSSKGNLSFNLKLAALPENLIKYIVLHEATHLIEKKHNKRFWNIIRKYHPDYKEKETLLAGFWFLVDKDKFWSEITQKN